MGCFSRHRSSYIFIVLVRPFFLQGSVLLISPLCLALSYHHKARLIMMTSCPAEV